MTGGAGSLAAAKGPLVLGLKQQSGCATQQVVGVNTKETKHGNLGLALFGPIMGIWDILSNQSQLIPIHRDFIWFNRGSLSGYHFDDVFFVEPVSGGFGALSLHIRCASTHTSTIWDGIYLLHGIRTCWQIGCLSARSCAVNEARQHRCNAVSCHENQCIIFLDHPINGNYL